MDTSWFKVAFLLYLCQGYIQKCSRAQEPLDMNLVQTPVQLPKLSSESVICTGDLFALKLPNSTVGTRPSDNSKAPTELILKSFFSFTNKVDPSTLYPNPTFHLIPAALLALDEINNSTDILKDFHLILDIQDSQCDAIIGREALFRSIVESSESDSPTVGLVGPGCSEVSEAVAGLYSRYLHVPQVSYGPNSFRLTSRTNFPSFFQLTQNVQQTTETIIGLLDYFNWTTRVALIYQDSEDYIITVQDLVVLDNTTNFFIKSDQVNNIIVQLTDVYQLSHLFGLRSQLEDFMRRVRDDETRVVVGLFSELTAARLICVAYQDNQTGPGEDGFVFVFVGVFSNQWWARDNGFCNLTTEDVESVLLVTSAQTVSDPLTDLPGGKRLGDFNQDYISKLLNWCPSYSNQTDLLASATYDAVWTLAYALNDSQDILSQIANASQRDLLEALNAQSIKQLHETDFNGASGRVRFTDAGERIGVGAVMQVQSGELVLIGYYNFSLGTLESVNENMLMWRSNSTPLDKPVEREESVPLFLLIISLLFTMTGIIFGFCMLFFNWYYREHKILVASSQRLNYIIIVGVFFGYFSVIILTFLESPLGQWMTPELFQAFCLIRIWMLVLAFTFTYGTLFARAWRIYRIFNDPWVSNRPLKDYHLLLMVLLVALGDATYLIPWTVVDPYRQFKTKTVDYSTFTASVFVSCSSDNQIAWLAITAIYKILIMIAGLLIINLVRRYVVERKIFDDSQSLAAALYISAISFVIGLLATVYFLLTFHIVYAYIATSLWVNCSSSGTLICIFLPKYYKIVLKKEKGREYQTSKSLFYCAHPDIKHSATSSPYVRGKFVHHKTVNFDITKRDIASIRGTENESSF